MRTAAGGILGRTPIAELARFLAVGASSTLLYFAVYSAAILLGVAFVLAAVLGFAVSAVYGYLVHQRWTFRTNTASTPGLSRWLLFAGRSGRRERRGAVGARASRGARSGSSSCR